MHLGLPPRVELLGHRGKVTASRHGFAGPCRRHVVSRCAAPRRASNPARFLALVLGVCEDVLR
eukprot:4329633-Prymnesium_polylepis.1